MFHRLFNSRNDFYRKKTFQQHLEKRGFDIISFRFGLEQDFRPRQRRSQFFGSVELIDQSRHDKKNLSWRKRNWRWTQNFFASKKKMSFFPVLRSPNLFLSHMFPLYLKTDTEALQPPEFFCSNGLPLASTRWVQSTLSSHFSLSSNLGHWLTSATLFFYFVKTN